MSVNPAPQGTAAALARAPTAPRVRLRPFLPYLLPAGVTLGLAVVWELACRVLRVPSFILPRPSVVWLALVSYRGAMVQHGMQTLLTTLGGFVLAVAAGLVLGVAVGQSRTVYDAVYPILVAFNSIPKAALVPVLVIWFGIGTTPAVLTAFLISFFPIAVNVATGLTALEPELQDVLRSLGASRRDIFTKVAFPRSLPYFFASLKVAMTLAFVGSVISETVASNRGIGYLMMAGGARFDVPLVFAGLAVVAGMGTTMYALCAIIERRLTAWTHRGETVVLVS